MKTALSATLFASAVLWQLGVAGNSWNDAASFSSPSNTNNNCSASQQGGFTWANLPPGSFNSFGGFDFSGKERRLSGLWLSN